MNKVTKRIFITVFSGVLAAACCIGLLLVSCLIPQESIEKNASASAKYFEKTPLFEELMKNQPSTKRDNYADCISFNIAYHFGQKDQDGTENTWIRALEARFTQDDGENVNDGFLRAVETGAEGNQTYSRYWHGGAAVIRLLLPLFSVENMRIVFLVIGIILNLCLIGYFIYRHDYALAIAYTVGIFFGKLFLGYVCFEYAFVCLLMPVVTFLVCFFAKESTDKLHINANTVKSANVKSANATSTTIIGCIFLCAGILTCFFDFLTAETLTFTVPMLVLMIGMLRNEKNYTVLKAGETKESKQKEKVKAAWKLFLQNGLLWSIGYAGMFLLKWLLAFFFLGTEETKTTLSFLAERSVGAVHATTDLASPTVSLPVRIAEIIIRNLACLFWIPENLSKIAQVLILCGIFLAFALLWYFLRSTDRYFVNHDKQNKNAGKVSMSKIKTNSETISNKKGKKNSFFPIILCLILIPFLRFFVLSNHSYMHSFFTYRALIPGVIAAIWFMIQTTVLSGIFKDR